MFHLTCISYPVIILICRDVYGNSVTQLPTGVFAGMTSLQFLFVYLYRVLLRNVTDFATEKFPIT